MQRNVLLERKENGKVIVCSIFSAEVESEMSDYETLSSRETEEAIKG